VRTTLTLDEDVADRLKAEVRRSGKPFRAVVNECLRLALSSRSRGRAKEPPFVVRARDLGALRPGLSLDNIGALLEAAEGSLHR
jgi:hypothetical protein